MKLTKDLIDNHKIKHPDIICDGSCDVCEAILRDNDKVRLKTFNIKLFIIKYIGTERKEKKITKIYNIKADNEKEAIEKAYTYWYDFGKVLDDENDQLIIHHEILKVKP